MSRRFLHGLRTSYATIDDSPILPTDGTNKAYVDLRSLPTGGTAGQLLVKNSSSNFDTSYTSSINLTSIQVGGNDVWHAGNFNPATKADNSISIIAGNGLTGGGTLAANRTLTLGAPSTITGSTANSVTTTSHTHALTVTKADVGLSNVDNTSDAAKPISTLTQTALNAKANSSISIIAGNGMTGGGTLAANRTLTLGTPGTITGSTANSVTTTSHTHALTVTKADVGLSNVDNTSDDAKPISTLTQTALLGKQNTITGSASSVVTTNLTPDMAIITNSSGKFASSGVYAGELVNLIGSTGNIQEQIDSKYGARTALILANGVTRTFQLGDENQIVYVTPGQGSTTLTVPHSSTADFPLGCELWVTGSTTNVSLNAESNVNVNIEGDWTAAANGGMALPLPINCDGKNFRLRKVNTNAWTIDNYRTMGSVVGLFDVLNNKLNTTGGTITGLLTLSNRLDLLSPNASAIGILPTNSSVGAKLRVTKYASGGYHPVEIEIHDGTTFRMLTPSGDTLSYGGKNLQHSKSPNYNTASSYSSNLWLAEANSANNILIKTGGSAVTFYLQPDSVSNMPIGTQILFYNNSTAALTISYTPGVSLRVNASASSGSRSLGFYTFAKVVKYAANSWIFSDSGVL